MTRLKLIFASLLLFGADVGFCINTGANLLSVAEQYEGSDYEEGNPPNINHVGEKAADFYLYHYYWGASTWNGEDAWTGGFDCSGLVSYAADLRRHYSSGELGESLLGPVKDWNCISRFSLQ